MKNSCFHNYFNVIYKTKSGRSVVAQRVLGVTAHEAKKRIETEMALSPTFDRILIAVKL